MFFAQPAECTITVRVLLNEGSGGLFLNFVVFFAETPLARECNANLCVQVSRTEDQARRREHYHYGDCLWLQGASSLGEVGNNCDARQGKRRDESKQFYLRY